VAYRKDAAPVSQDLSGTVNVDGYLQTVMRSNKAIWSEIFKGVSGVSMPALTYDVTSKSDRYVSACTRNGEKIVVTPTYGKFFYCSADNQPYGAVALPTDVLTPVWKQNSRQRADLAVAVSTSRQASLIILKSLEQQLSLPKPSDIGRQYTASCLAGVWGHAVYAQDAFPVQDLGTALSWSFAIPSEVDGTVTSPNPRNDEPAVTAWTAGFRTGDPSQCGLRFWN
jgi:predicted metalloprotease